MEIIPSPVRQPYFIVLCNSLSPNTRGRQCFIIKLISRSIRWTEVCCGADRAVCLLSPTQSAWCRCSKTCCGYPASPAQRRMLHSNPTPCWLPSIFSISKNIPSSHFLIMHIYNSLLSETLQVLTCPHIFFTHLLVNTQRIPPIFFSCMRWIFSIHVA